MTRRDLFVVVADLDAENAIGTLLCDRQRALGIELDFSATQPPQGDLLRYVGRDAGCYRDAVDLLRVPQRTHTRAMLLFDRHGSGARSDCRETIESHVETSLCRSGWSGESVCAIAIEPELESWVWASSPRVADVLGWGTDGEQLRQFLNDQGLWGREALKPDDPKQAMKLALREKNKPFGARLFAELAARVGLGQCQDPAFEKFRRTLQQWFRA